MDEKLKRLFDYQRFMKNEKLTSLIEETESRQGMELSDEDLLFAAGGLSADQKPLDFDLPH